MLLIILCVWEEGHLPRGLEGESRQEGKKEGLWDFSPDPMFLSFHMIHLYVPEGCSVLAAKTSHWKQVLKVMKCPQSHIYKRKAICREGDEMGLSFPRYSFNLCGHGGLNCTHRALKAKKCSIWIYKFKPSPNFPFRSLTPIAQFFMILKSFTSPRLQWWLRNDNNLVFLKGRLKYSPAHLTADYRRVPESVFLTGTESVFSALCSLYLSYNYYTLTDFLAVRTFDKW